MYTYSIQEHYGKYIVAREPKTIGSGYKEFWSGNGWVQSESDAQHFDEDEADDYLEDVSGLE